MNILDYIPKGKENAVTREALCICTGLDDRTVRKLIELARDGGAPILSSSRYVGYWLSDDITEIKAFLSETDRRCRSLSRRAQGLRRYVAELEGFYTVPVQAHFRTIKRS
jgi:hypothetical protein